MRTFSAAFAIPGMTSAVDAVMVASSWRRVMLMSRFLCLSLYVDRESSRSITSSGARLRNSGSGEFDQMHGRQEVCCERRDGGIGIAPEYGLYDGRVFGFRIPGLSGFAADRKPAVALALLVQDISKA